jgi:hypothetical protein
VSGGGWGRYSIRFACHGEEGAQWGDGLFTCSPAATCCRRTNHSPAKPVLPDACPSCLLVLNRDVAMLCSHRRQETNGESETSR